MCICCLKLLAAGDFLVMIFILLFFALSCMKTPYWQQIQSTLSMTRNVITKEFFLNNCVPFSIK